MVSLSPVTPIVPLEVGQWETRLMDPRIQERAIHTLEDGGVILLPALPFALLGQEKAYLRPDCVDPKAKSLKYFLPENRLWGAASPEKDDAVLSPMLHRYGECARKLVSQLFPRYMPHLAFGNTSLRTVAAEARKQSLRHDDRLLHVDAFPSRPSAGKRLLRVFTNVNPEGRARHWRLGEHFEGVARRFLKTVPDPVLGSAALLNWLGITKSKRTRYDHFMLGIHDAMKRDPVYQKIAPQVEQAFAPGVSWIFFSDQVPHAVTSGQHVFEQTFILPPTALIRPEYSPLAVLERIKGAKLT